MGSSLGDTTILRSAHHITTRPGVYVKRNATDVSALQTPSPTRKRKLVAATEKSKNGMENGPGIFNLVLDGSRVTRTAVL